MCCGLVSHHLFSLLKNKKSFIYIHTVKTVRVVLLITWCNYLNRVNDTGFSVGKNEFNICAC